METQKIEYPFIPEGRKILYVNENDSFMKEAKNVAWKQSTDRRFSTGAVIVCDGVVVSSSANQAPLTSKILINLHKKYCLRRIFKIPSGKKYWVCPGCAGGDHHAEYRASEKLIKRGYDKNKKYDLYLWGHWWACRDCWGEMLKIPVNDLYLMKGSETIFNEKVEGNIVGNQFDDLCHSK